MISGAFNSNQKVFLIRPLISRRGRCVSPLHDFNEMSLRQELRMENIISLKGLCHAIVFNFVNYEL